MYWQHVQATVSDADLSRSIRVLDDVLPRRTHGAQGSETMYAPAASPCWIRDDPRDPPVHLIAASAAGYGASVPSRLFALASGIPVAYLDDLFASLCRRAEAGSTGRMDLEYIVLHNLHITEAWIEEHVRSQLNDSQFALGRELLSSRERKLRVDIKRNSFSCAESCCDPSAPC